MRVVQLTAAQQTEAASLKSTATAASQTAQESRKALTVFLEGIAGKPAPGRHQRLTLTDDNSSVIVTP